MKRSAAVPLTLVAAAGALAACAREPQAEALNCVESASGRVVPDSLCRAAGASRPVAGAPGTGGTPAAANSGNPGGFGISPVGLFGWYYGGRVLSGLASGGSYAPVAGRSYRSPSGAFLGASATRSGSAVRPTMGGAFGGGRGATAARGGTTRGGFGGTAVGRAGG